MFVVQAGMEKSGSAYFYNIINELLIESGKGVDARQLRENENLHRTMRFHNNNIGRLSPIKLLKLKKLSQKVGFFTVKTHAGPNLFSDFLVKRDDLRIIYSYRDPRDVLLSALDHGRRIRDQGESHTFAKLVTFEDALRAVMVWLKICNLYLKRPHVLSIKYEDMMQAPETYALKIVDYLNLEVGEEKIREILWKFSKDNPTGEREGLHLNKAIVHRYRSEMSDEQQQKCLTVMGDFLKRMGYVS